jgi:hypothetical protein
MQAIAGLSIRQRRRTIAAVSGLGGALIALAALAAAVLVALAFAATLLLVTILASLLLGLAGLTLRMRPQPVHRRQLVERRPAGHAWIPYHWDERTR